MDTTTTLPGKMIFPESIKPWRSIGAKPGNRYKIVTMHIAAPADLSDDKIVEALNFTLTNTYVDEGAPLADDWQFLARDGAVGDNDHFREAVIPADDLFANTPQAIFENWYLVPEGIQCPQCERFFTAPEDIAAIGDHELCTTCLAAWRVTAAMLNYAPGSGCGDGYSEEPPFLLIPEWWAARGLTAPADDAATPLTIEQVKETLPNVQVKSLANGKTYTAKVRGRRNPFAEVSWDTDCGVMYAEFAWETVTNAINSGKVLKA